MSGQLFIDMQVIGDEVLALVSISYNLHGLHYGRWHSVATKLPTKSEPQHSRCKA